MRFEPRPSLLLVTSKDWRYNPICHTIFLFLPHCLSPLQHLLPPPPHTHKPSTTITVPLPTIFFPSPSESISLGNFSRAVRLLFLDPFTKKRGEGKGRKPVTWTLCIWLPRGIKAVYLRCHYQARHQRMGSYCFFLLVYIFLFLLFTFCQHVMGLCGSEVYVRETTPNFLFSFFLSLPFSLSFPTSPLYLHMSSCNFISVYSPPLCCILSTFSSLCIPSYITASFPAPYYPSLVTHFSIFLRFLFLIYTSAFLPLLSFYILCCHPSFPLAQKHSLSLPFDASAATKRDPLQKGALSVPVSLWVAISGHREQFCTWRRKRNRNIYSGEFVRDKFIRLRKQTK